MSLVRLLDLLSEIPVDPRTLETAVKKAGVRVHRVGRSGPLVSEADFQTIRENGIEYYKDKMTTKGIQ